MYFQLLEFATTSSVKRFTRILHQNVSAINFWGKFVIHGLEQCGCEMVECKSVVAVQSSYPLGFEAISTFCYVCGERGCGA